MEGGGGRGEWQTWNTVTRRPARAAEIPTHRDCRSSGGRSATAGHRPSQPNPVTQRQRGEGRLLGRQPASAPSAPPASPDDKSAASSQSR